MFLMYCCLEVSSVQNLSAQTLSWETFVEKLTNEDDEDYSLWSYLYEDLCWLHENPININSTSTEELGNLPFLSHEQIEEIEAYVYSYGPLLSLGELNLIKGLDYETRQLLSLFIYCGEKNYKEKNTLAKMLTKGKNQIVLRTDIPLYKRAAYNDYPDSVLQKSPNKVYQGNALYHSLRYNYHYGQKLEWGFTIEKDAGENYVDSYSYYLLIRNLGMLKTLALGKYRLGFAQGLVLNTNFSMGKTSILSQLSAATKGIRKHSSTSETGYFQGIAATIGDKKSDFTVFYSYLPQDATLTKDSLISTLKTDGYHRTLLEKSKKNNVYNHLIGGNLSYSNNGFHVGITGLYTVFNRMFTTYNDSLHYKYYYPRGNKFSNTSIDYAYHHYRFSFQGETAMDFQGGLATVNSISYKLSEDYRLVALHRYYSEKYNAIYGNAFSEAGMVKNENGLYIGVTGQLSKQLKSNAYVDIFTFPYTKYQVSKLNSKGIDILGELEFTASDNFQALLRYRCKVSQKDYKDPNSDRKALANNVTQKWRLQLNYKLNMWSFRSEVDFSQLNIADGKPDMGYAFTQQATLYTDKIQLSTNAVYFHTDSYASRVYSYEQGMLYSFSFPSYYYHGYRLSSVLRYNISKKILFLLKYGHTQYFNKSTIGSGIEQINCSHKDDLQLQLIIKV
ncbi:MAG: helix-hairpin-helix domain-containing protein [Bacteroidales bacterium]|nr:helix-hairpin-helix domain-containing protein [Bacteroidales bacterium]